jgi:hypothetical protein
MEMSKSRSKMRCVHRMMRMHRAAGVPRRAKSPNCAAVLTPSCRK